MYNPVERHHISSIKALLFTTILYGITTPFLIGIILHVANNKESWAHFTTTGFQILPAWLHCCSCCPR